MMVSASRTAANYALGKSQVRTAHKRSMCVGRVAKGQLRRRIAPASTIIGSSPPAFSYASLDDACAERTDASIKTVPDALTFAIVGDLLLEVEVSV
jgi:hypothetical protein